MSTISDTRKTVLEIINEVRRKLGVSDAATLSDDKNSITLLDYLNDVVSYVADFGDWQETMQEVTVTASTSVFQYLVNTSAPLQHIQEIAFEGQVAALRYVDVEEMRRWRRIGGTGIPRNWTIFTVDNTTTGNPYIQVYPQPGTNENNQTFSLLCFTKPPKYTTSDASVIPPFPARMLVSMLLALALLDESRGTQNIDYYTELQRFNDTIEQTLNRYTSDSGGDVKFVPRRGGFNKL